MPKVAAALAFVAPRHETALWKPSGELPIEGHLCQRLTRIATASPNNTSDCRAILGVCEALSGLTDEAGPFAADARGRPPRRLLFRRRAARRIGYRARFVSTQNEEFAMRKYMCMHTLPEGAFTRDHVYQFAEAAQHDPDVRGYRSFVNLTEGKVCCILEADDQDRIAAWFHKMGIPYDSIVAVEFEGERGLIEDLTEHPTLAGTA